MEAERYQLAQVNVARMRAPLSAPSMAGFSSRIQEINAAAEAAPGYVWRWTDDNNGPFTAPDLLFNLSVWESVGALRDYVYRRPHVELFRDRAEWFLPFDRPSLALWWIPPGHLPTPWESDERLNHLAQHGPTPFAFTFSHSFPA